MCPEPGRPCHAATHSSTLTPLNSGRRPWRRLNAVPARAARKLDPAIPAEAYLSTLGGTGNAGYLPVVHIGKPQEGETAFVSGAAGATGLVAAQTLKLLGCTVVGSAGSDDKVALLEGLGVAAFNYKTEDTLSALQRLCPGGRAHHHPLPSSLRRPTLTRPCDLWAVDIYFDNGDSTPSRLRLERGR